MLTKSWFLVFFHGAIAAGFCHGQVAIQGAFAPQIESTHPSAIEQKPVPKSVTSGEISPKPIVPGELYHESLLQVVEKSPDAAGVNTKLVSIFKRIEAQVKSDDSSEVSPSADDEVKDAVSDAQEINNDLISIFKRLQEQATSDDSSKVSEDLNGKGVARLQLTKGGTQGASGTTESPAKSDQEVTDEKSKEEDKQSTVTADGLDGPSSTAGTTKDAGQKTSDDSKVKELNKDIISIFKRLQEQTKPDDSSKVAEERDEKGEAELQAAEVESKGASGTTEPREKPDPKAETDEVKKNTTPADNLVDPVPAAGNLQDVAPQKPTGAATEGSNKAGDSSEAQLEFDKNVKSLEAKLDAVSENFDLTSHSGWKLSNEIIALLKTLEKSKGNGLFGGFQKEIETETKSFSASRSRSEWALKELSEIFSLSDSTAEMRRVISSRVAVAHESNPSSWMALQLTAALQSFGTAHVSAFNELAKQTPIATPSSVSQDMMRIDYCGCDPNRSHQDSFRGIKVDGVVQVTQTIESAELTSLRKSIDQIFTAVIQSTTRGIEPDIAEASFKALFEMTIKLDLARFEALWSSTFEHFRSSLSNVSTNEKVAVELVKHVYAMVLPARNAATKAPVPNDGQLKKAKDDFFNLATSSKPESLSTVARKRFRELNLSDEQILRFYLSQ